jgi:hypothetical protein
LAQLLAAPAALHPAAASTRLVLLETASALTLVRVLLRIPASVPGNLAGSFEPRAHHHGDDLWWRAWAARPFQYSSACSPALADVLLDLLVGFLEQDRNAADERDRAAGATMSPQLNCAPPPMPPSPEGSSWSLLDPTCGSGTLLACAARRGLAARGLDVNPRCASGANANLAHLQVSFDAARAAVGDATRPQALAALATSLRSPTTHLGSYTASGSSTSNVSNVSINTSNSCHGYNDGDTSNALEIAEAPLLLFDCAVANLPWGRHSVAYAGNNAAFLDALACGRVLKPCAPCAFVVGAGDGAALMVALAARGFELCLGGGSSDTSRGLVPGPACVPPRGLHLPPSKKTAARRPRATRETAAAEDASGETGSARTPSRSDCEVVVARTPRAPLLDEVKFAMQPV